MYLANPSNTQVYSPFGSYVVEQHATQFEAVEMPSLRKASDVLSNEQAAVGLKLQRYYPIHAVGPTPTRLQILLNMVFHKSETDQL